MELHQPEPNNNVDEATKLEVNNDDITSPSLLTLRMIMQGKEAGSIIGKKGDNVKKFREESGARINISDASCPERIVTVTGTTQQIVDAFSMICRRFEEDLQTANQSRPGAKQLITLRLIVPASQCGSLIGKAGAKIKEIREVAGASIQISSDMLPNSTERLITVSGSVDAVTRGIYHICQVMLESPAKGVTVPYRPKLAALAAPVLVAANGQTFALQPGQFIIPQPTIPREPSYYQAGIPAAAATAAPGHIIQYQPVHPQFAKVALQQGMLGYTALPQTAFLASSYPGSVQCALPGGYIRTAGPPSLMAPGTQQTQIHEMKIPNDLIGCIIGRGGSKINEIRQLSGANIKIAGLEETSPDRTVTISGSPESINFAQHLINASIDLHTSLTQSLLELDQSSSLSAIAQCKPATSTIPLPIQPLGSSPVASQLTDQSALNPAPTIIGLPMTPMQHHGISMPPIEGTVATGLTQIVNQSTTVLQFDPGNFATQQMLPIVQFDSGLPASAFVDNRNDFAPKIKGSLTLASFAKTGSKFSPY